MAFALEGISDWIKNNQGPFDAIVVTIGAFAAAWKAVDLAEFLMNAGGVVGLLSKLKDATWGCVTAKIADKLETVQICAMYAKEFVTGLAKSTAELIKNAAQWVTTTAAKIADTAATVAYTASMWLAEAATTAFGVAMSVLTSPITLVIAALAALGIAIYELVKHWDEVKEAAGKCWDWITDKWCKAGDWFKGIWQNIKSAFSSFDNWLQNIFNIDFSDSFGFIGNIMNAYLNNVSNIFGDVKQIFGGLIDFIAGVFSGDWSRAWEGIVDAFGGIFSMIADIAKGPINMVIGLINGMLDGLESGINWMVRKVNSLSFDVPDWVPVIGGDHFGFDLPEVGFGNVPYLAQGGYVKPNTPQLAMIGDNKHQGEVVAPEDKLIDMAQKAAAMASSAELLAEAISILKQILKILETLDLDIQLDGKSLKKYVVDKINEHTKQTGKCEIIT